jgi:hypothetical protein
MNESQFKQLALWQQRAAQITTDFERYAEALALFGEDPNFDIWLDGTVGFIDHSKSMTFGEAAGYEWSPQYWKDREAFVNQHGRWH